MNSKRVIELLRDAIEGVPEDGYSPEESDFRKKLDRDVELAKKKGFVIAVPSELEMEDGDDSEEEDGSDGEEVKNG